MYKWTFKEGKTVRGNGWTIAIPDGYVKIKSDDVLANSEKRPFELVPAKYKNEDDIDLIPVRILPGMDLNEVFPDDSSIVHPKARTGVAASLAYHKMEMITKLTGDTAEILSTTWDNVIAAIMIMDTSSDSYSYQIMVYAAKGICQFRIQTQSITDTEKEQLSKSVIEWLHTMKLDNPTKYCAAKAKIEDPYLCNKILKNGNLKAFDEAVDQIQDEYNYSLTGMLNIIRNKAEIGVIDKDYATKHKNKIVDMLKEATAVREFYLEKMNDLIIKLQNAKASRGVLKKIFKKLHDINTSTISLHFGVADIDVEPSAREKDILKKWKDMEETANAPTPEERKKAEEEKKRQEEKRRKEEEERRKQEEKRKKEEEERRKQEEELRIKREEEAARKKKEERLRKEKEKKIESIEKEYNECLKEIESLERESVKAEKAVKMFIAALVFDIIAVLIFIIVYALTKTAPAAIMAILFVSPFIFIPCIISIRNDANAINEALYKSRKKEKQLKKSLEEAKKEPIRF